MPSKSKSQQRLMGMVHACQKSGKCASDKISEIADSINASDATDFAETKHKNLPNKIKAESITFREYMLEGYYEMPDLDRERYINREHEGLEGPYRQDNGKVLYYDTKEGKYYDPDSDFYVSNDDLAAMQHSQEKRNELMQQQRERDFERRR